MGEKLTLKKITIIIRSIFTCFQIEKDKRIHLPIGK